MLGQKPKLRLRADPGVDLQSGTWNTYQTGAVRSDVFDRAHRARTIVSPHRRSLHGAVRRWIVGAVFRAGISEDASARQSVPVQSAAGDALHVETVRLPFWAGCKCPDFNSWVDDRPDDSPDSTRTSARSNRAPAKVLRRVNVFAERRSISASRGSDPRALFPTFQTAKSGGFIERL